MGEFMYKVERYINNSKYDKLFLALPKKLYGKKQIMQNIKEENEILNNKHILSRYFDIYKFIVIDENDEIYARAIVTTYKDDINAYVGYFECIENYEISDMLLKSIDSFVKELGYDSIIGPLNCSFWIGYRFKTNFFESPYMGEPYNKEYYPKMFKEAGYEMYERYSSNGFGKVMSSQENKKFTQRLDKMIEKGYVFKEPNNDSFDNDLKEIGRLILDLYSKFPAYKAITEEEFYMMYKDLKKIIKYNMVKLAYYNDELVGFFVSIPNYKNSINSMNYFNIIKTKLFTKEYIMLYLGVKKEHLGLGSALAELMKEELKKNKCTSIGALIKNGNANRVYFKELIKKEYEYVLLNKKI